MGRVADRERKSGKGESGEGGGVKMTGWLGFAITHQHPVIQDAAISAYKSKKRIVNIHLRSSKF